VDKIVGPGNVCDRCQELVAFDCPIDFLGGPNRDRSSNHRGKAIMIASDLVASGKHDPRVLVFITHLVN